MAGASFGNAGHIAAELVQPLPSPALLFGFYRELFRFGGTLDLSAAAGAAHVAVDPRIRGRGIPADEEHPALGAAGAPLGRDLGALGRRPSAGRNCSSVMGTTRLHWARRARLTCTRYARGDGADRREDPTDVQPKQLPAAAARRKASDERGPVVRGLGATSIDPLEAVRALRGRGAEMRRDVSKTGRARRCGRAATRLKS